MMVCWTVFLLVIPMICCSGQSTTTTPTLNPTTTPTTHNPGGWLQAVEAAVAHVLGRSATQNATNEITATQLINLLSQLPGLVQGLGGIDVSHGDAATVLAKLFSDPRAAGIPAWIEALTQRANSSWGQFPYLLNSQASGNQSLAVMSRLFSDVTRALQSLHLNANSSLQDVVTNVMKDPSLMSSLSTDALQLLLPLTGHTDLQGLLQQAFPLDLQSQCAADLLAWANALQRGDLGAIQMLDAMGKLQAGVMTGQLVFVGDYEECRAVAFTDNNTSHTVQAKFCPVVFTPPSALGRKFQDKLMTLHVCLPKSCNETDLYGLLQPTLQALGSEHRGMSCAGPLSPEGDSIFIGVTTTLAVLAFLCFVGTAYGVLLEKRRARCQQQSQQKSQPQTISMEVKAHTNHGYVNDDSLLRAQTHKNGGLTNGDAHSGSHVTGSTANGDASKMKITDHVTGYVKHREGGEDKKALEVEMGKPQFPGGPVVSVPETTATNSGKSSSGSSPASVQEGALSKLLLSFSVLENGQKVLNCERNPADISCLHGIRVISITWVVLGHAYVMIAGSIGNGVMLYTALGEWTFMAIPAGVLSVDTFFLLSGCLSAYLFLRASKKSGLSVSGLVLYYIHRVWRLTPLYAVLVAVYVGIFPYLKEGPYQNTFGMDSQGACHNHWHLNLLYVNNVVGPLKDLCFSWSWYLANDMQFAFVAPLILVPWGFRKCSMKRLQVLGILLCFALILTHCISTGVISYTDDLSMLSQNNLKYMEKIYFPPWTRVGPYAVGLLLGYLLFVLPPKCSLGKLWVFGGWTLSTTVALTLVYVRYDNVRDTPNRMVWTSAQMAAFESLDKVLWSVCISWVIFACYKGYGGFVNTLLSWSAWLPLSRLTYGVYLVHCIVLYVLAGQFKKPLYLDNWAATTLYLAVTVLSFGLSFVFSMLVEAPTLGLEKVVLGKIFHSKK